MSTAPFKLISAMMRSNPTGNLMATSHVVAGATRGRVTYENYKVKQRSYRSAAKEKRKQARRARMAGAGSIKDSGEEIPPFFMP